LDRDIDVAQRIRSIPARFGEASGRRLPLALHLAMAVVLGIAGLVAHVGPLYYAGIVAVLALVWYENRLFERAPNVFVLNEGVFISNMCFSVVFLITTYAGFAWR
jgi:4-hydroxybenzoate polyprenyltransferase